MQAAHGNKEDVPFSYDENGDCYTLKRSHWLGCIPPVLMLVLCVALVVAPMLYPEQVSWKASGGGMLTLLVLMLLYEWLRDTYWGYLR